MAAQDALQILVEDEPRPDQAAVGSSAPDRALAACVHRRDLGEDRHGTPADDEPAVLLCFVVERPGEPADRGVGQPLRRSVTAASVTAYPSGVS